MYSFLVLREKHHQPKRRRCPNPRVRTSTSAQPCARPTSIQRRHSEGIVCPVYMLICICRCWILSVYQKLCLLFWKKKEYIFWKKRVTRIDQNVVLSMKHFSINFKRHMTLPVDTEFSKNKQNVLFKLKCDFRHPQEESDVKQIDFRGVLKRRQAGDPQNTSTHILVS